MSPQKHGWAYAEKCTRITADGRQCPMPHLIWRWGGTDPLACWNHLTKEERKRWNDGKAADREQHRTRLRALAAREPACWSWPIPEPLETASDEERFDAFHGGRCAMCGATAGPHVLHTDHDHTTGLTRGKLCSLCNVQEGFAKDTSDGRG